MDIWVTRLNPRTHRLRVERGGHDPVDSVLETRSLLLHDFAHYAVEAEHGIEDGFYGLLADGADPDDLREQRLPPEQWERLMKVEFAVVRLQSAFRRGEVLVGDGAWRRLRSLHGAWSKARMGEAVHLQWPPAPPELIPVTRVPALRV